MDKVLEYARTTLIGGGIFVLPLLFVIFIIKKAVELLHPIADPLIARFRVDSVIGTAATTVVSLLFLLLVAFLCGLFAQTLIGQSLIKRMQAGIVSFLPRFNLMQGIAQSLDGKQGKEVPVVLVRTDAGWGIALQLEERHGDWCTVYVPGSPQWTAGSVSFAHIDDVHPVSVPLGRSLLLMRTCGVGSKDICDILSELKGRGAI